VPHRLHHFRAAGCVPQAHTRLVAGGRHHPAVGAEGQIQDVAHPWAEDQARGQGVDIPVDHLAAGMAAGQRHPVRADRQRVRLADRLRVRAGQDGHLRTAGRVP